MKYETKFLDFGKGEQKDPEYTKYNPNGREYQHLIPPMAEEMLMKMLSCFPGIPTIIDHDNNDFTLWESIAIMKYLVETYDKEKKLFFPGGTKESYQVDQWLAFQSSGQVSY